MKKFVMLSAICALMLGVNQLSNSQTLTDKEQKATVIATNDVAGEYKTISLAEVKSMVEKKQGQVLDVRTIEEIAETGMIKGAKNIPIAELESRLGELDKNKTYITFCAKGGRSAKAAALLSKAGFKNIYNASEGMTSWNYPELIVKK